VNTEATHIGPAVLELIVNDHPGIMSQVCGLAFRRAFNVVGMLCLPLDDGHTRRIWLRVDDSARLDQVENQLRKLYDVREVHRHPRGHPVFQGLDDYVASASRA
jgi:acetolactate synthase I/III small subunit